MSSLEDSTTLTLNDTQADEDRMRAALGLTPEHEHPARQVDQYHKPGRASEVPVTIVSNRRPHDTSDISRARIATLEDALKAERSERVAAQQALADAQRATQQLQTKLAHTEMAAAEALKAEQTARLAAEARLLEITPGTAPKLATDELPGPRKRGRPPGARRLIDEPEPEPVQWWLPSYKAPTAKRVRPKT